MTTTTMTTGIVTTAPPTPLTTTTNNNNNDDDDDLNIVHELDMDGQPLHIYNMPHSQSRTTGKNWAMKISLDY